MPLTITLAAETWPIAGSFAISRGAKSEAVVVVAELGDGKARGRGECVPYRRYGESVDSVFAALEAMKGAVFSGLDRTDLQKAMPPGAARNALDAAFWDIDAKRAYCRVTELLGIGPMRPVVTAYTLSLDTAERMGAAAAIDAADGYDASGPIDSSSTAASAACNAATGCWRRVSGRPSPKATSRKKMRRASRANLRGLPKLSR